MNLNEGEKERWHRDVDDRQRNIVFPDTAANESRFWRNLISGRRKLSVTQIIGIAIMYLTLAAVVYDLVSTQLRASDAQGNLWERIVGNFGVWIAVVGIAVGLVAIGQLVSRHTSRHTKPPSDRSLH